MATFSTNQVRHLYVAKAQKTAVAATDTAGTIAVLSDTAKNHMYFSYKSVDNLMRSDLIDLKNIIYAKAASASTMAHKIKSFKVTLNSSINSGKPVSGQDYILRIAFKQYVGMSDEDQYFKYGMVHAYATMTASDFYKTLAISLVKNFSREITPLVKFALVSTGTSGDVTTDVDSTTKESALTGTYTGVLITEVEQPWRRGVMQQTFVDFSVQPSVIVVSGEELVWGTVTDGDSTATIGNGKNIADLEYFCMGERGDIYRGVGFPNNIPTTYLVDETKTYHTLDILYAYTGSNESVQKSEKTITIVSDNKDTMNAIIAAVNKITGLTIATVS